MSAIKVSRKENRANAEKAIEAIVWYFGFSRKEALEYLGNNSRAVIDGIVQRYEDNAKLAFYND